MKTVSYIQNLIKSKTKLCVFVDYENVIKMFTPAFDDDMFSARATRIFQNFSKCSFMKLFVITGEKSNKKELAKLQKQVSNVEFFVYDEEYFDKLCVNHEKLYAFGYLGSDIDVINKIQARNGFTISINPKTKKLEKLVDLYFSKTKFEDVLIETNNICL